MAGSRAPLRFVSIGLALLRWGVGRARPAAPRRILVLHHLLLGDTLMLTGLLAKLREQFPDAVIEMTVPRAFAPLYSTRPFGVTVSVLDPRDVRTLWPLLRGARFDLAILPSDNRWSWLARAIGTRWIVGIAGDRPDHKNWPVDELVPYSPTPTAFSETASELIPGPAPANYRTAQWPAPPCAEAIAFAVPYAVLHIGASSSLKLWEPERWRRLAAWLEARSIDVVWSVGPGEAALLESVDPEHQRRRIAGTLPLAALWHVLARAQLLVCPDTGIAHLGRVAGVPTVALFGPGSTLLCGPGLFFSEMPGRTVTIENFPCRDQRIQFFREVPWIRRCERLHGESPARCPRPLCMEAITLDAVTTAIASLGIDMHQAPAAAPDRNIISND